MKRVIPAAILLACIAVICIISNIAVSKSINTAKSEIEYCKECYKKSEFDKAKGSADTFNKLWIKKSRKFLQVLKKLIIISKSQVKTQRSVLK